jgi:uncharacterized protein with PIN domain
MVLGSIAGAAIVGGIVWLSVVTIRSKNADRRAEKNVLGKKQDEHLAKMFNESGGQELQTNNRAPMKTGSGVVEEIVEEEIRESFTKTEVLTVCDGCGKRLKITAGATDICEYCNAPVYAAVPESAKTKVIKKTTKRIRVED